VTPRAVRLGRVGLLVALALGAATWCGDACAQEKRDPVAADYLFREARKAARAGDYAKACPLFVDSLRLDPGTGVLMNLADCEEHLGKVASAWEHWREALDTLHGKNDKRAALARRKIAALDKRLPRLTLRLEPGAPPDTRVERDGLEIGGSAIGLPVPVDPGTHKIIVRAPRHQDRTYTIALSEAQVAEQSVSPGGDAPDRTASTTPSSFTSSFSSDPSAAPPPPPPASGTAARMVGYGFVGVGVIGLGVGAVAGLVALDKKNTVQQHCQADPAGGVGCTDQTGLDAAATGRTMSTVSTIGFAAGAASVAIGVVLLVTSGHGGGTTTTALTPQYLPGGAGLSFARAF
jgi:hypothetical protein